MALINTLRNRMGKIVVVFLALSMGAFILTDLFQSNSFLFGGSSDIGEMANSTVSYKEFQEKLEKLSYNYALNTGRNPTGAQIELLRNQAWQELIIDRIFAPQFEELGIVVTDEEMVEMVQGTNIHPSVRQAFTNPQTGVFEKEQLISYLQQLNTLPPRNKESWISFEEGLRPLRAMTKYENLFTLTNYVSKYEAKDEYVKAASTASVDYLYIPYFSIPDSAVSVTESELQDYLEAHADEYQKEQTKNIDYVSFMIAPSTEDSAAIRQEVADLREGLMNAEDDSLFASINSDGNTPFQTFNQSRLPETLQSQEVGFTAEATLEGNRYTVYKISGIEEGDESFVRASHILFKPTDESDGAKAEARRKGNEVLRDLRRGSDFEEMARIHGTDGTASRGGDLGWFGENGNFHPDFKDATFAFSGTGLLRQLVETPFGFHIIKVTEPKTNSLYKVAMVEKELFVSDETLNSTYRDAELFALEAKSRSAFATKSTELGIEVKKARLLKQNDTRVGPIVNARNIVFWLFNEAEQGEVSDVFELNDRYVVALQTSHQEEGLAELITVRNEISRKVMDEKKAEVIISQLQASSGTTLEEISGDYGSEARVNSAEITLNSTSIPSVGYAPEAVGLAFALEAGEQTEAFQVANGVMMLLLNDRQAASELEDYSDYITNVLNTRRTFKRREDPFIDQNIYEAAVESATIEDHRYKFF